MPASNPQFLTTPDTLTRGERRLFDFLARRPDHVFTKDELVRATEAHSTRELDATAMRLRRKLQDFDTRRAVVNVWGVGYRMNDPVG